MFLAIGQGTNRIPPVKYIYYPIFDSKIGLHMSSTILSHILGQNRNQLPHNRTQENLTTAVLNLYSLTKSHLHLLVANKI